MKIDLSKVQFPVKIVITCENKQDLATLYAVTSLREYFNEACFDNLAETDKIEMAFVLAELACLIIDNA